jgi:hypothetical protein
MPMVPRSYQDNLTNEERLFLRRWRYGIATVYGIAGVWLASLAVLTTSGSNSVEATDSKAQRVAATLSTSRARAQTGPNTFDKAIGDVWSSREELVYVPREALELPDAVEPGDVEIATGDVLPTPKSGYPLPQQAFAPKIESNKISEQASR